MGPKQSTSWPVACVQHRSSCGFAHLPLGRVATSVVTARPPPDSAAEKEEPDGIFSLGAGPVVSFSEVDTPSYSGYNPHRTLNLFAGKFVL